MVGNNIYLPGVIQIPSSLTITAITQTNPAVITASVNPISEANTYIAGQYIKLNVPSSYGMIQANGQMVKILSVNANVFTVDMNATQFDSFVVPPQGSPGPATLAPNGSRNLQFNNFTDQVPFQSLNNIGN